jgi:hypothetical protein
MILYTRHLSVLLVLGLVSIHRLSSTDALPAVYRVLQPTAGKADYIGLAYIAAQVYEISFAVPKSTEDEASRDGRIDQFPRPNAMPNRKT